MYMHAQDDQGWEAVSAEDGGREGCGGGGDEEE